MYQHFICHFRDQLLVYTEGSCCKLCGKEQRQRNLLRHVGTVHGILDQLLPPDIVETMSKKKTREYLRILSISGSETDTEIDRMGKVNDKLDLEEDFQVRIYRVYLFDD
jgi:hypothetical protein